MDGVVKHENGNGYSNGYSNGHDEDTEDAGIYYEADDGEA